MLKFTEHFKIPKGEQIEFLDIPINKDLLAFIDPFLIANNRGEPIFGNVYLQIKGFFEKLNRDFIVPNNVSEGLAFLSHLHEPNEYHLGYSDENKGKAISETRATIIFAALRNNRFARSGTSTITNEAHNVLLLVGGIGQDIMSDTIANVCRDIFADFTKQQCIKHKIVTDKFTRYFYNASSGIWEIKELDLPSYKGKPIILLPSRIMSSLRSYTNNYNHFVAGHFIAQDILNGKIKVANDGKYIVTLKDGRRKPVVKKILETYRKPKALLYEFVVDYNDSLIAFLDYAKEHYPGLDYSGL